MKAPRWTALVWLVGLALVVSACTSGSDAADPADAGSAATIDAAVERPGSSTDAEADGSDPPADPVSNLVARELTEEEQAELDASVAQFIDDRSVVAARSVVQLIERSGDIAYAPWLVDLAQMGLSNLLSDEIIDVLAGLTGLATTGNNFADFGQMGSLVDSQQIEPAAGYREWKLALFDRLDPEFRPLLDSVTAENGFNRIRYGGVRRGGIPELNSPARISAEDALAWITDDEVVLGVDLDGEVVAYPFRIVGHHELVNDTVAGVPVSLVYCTLCRTGLLFDRRVDGRVLDFQTSGMLINSNKIMVDRQTDTLWHHAAGLGIGGELVGTTLEAFPMETTTWVEWYAEHPDTEVIDIPPPIFFDDPERPPLTYPYEPDSAYSEYYADPLTWFPIRDVSDAFETKAEVLGVQHAGGVLAVSVSDIVSGPSRYFPLGDGVVVVVPNSRGARVYAGGPEVVASFGELEPGSEVFPTVADADSAVLTEGPTLERLAVEQGFWFSWFDRHPDTDWWPR